jgi:AraC-like DNA-binding protein
MSVSISLVRTLIEAVERAGVAPDAFLAASKLDRALVEDANSRIDLPTYDALQELALDMTKDPALGLHMGEHASLAAFQIVGLLAAHCRTIRDGLQVFFRYHRIIADCPASYLEERGDESVLIYNFLRTTPRCSRLRAEFGVTRLLRIAQMFAGVAATPREVWFEHAEPPYADEYVRMFGEKRVRFSQPTTGIVMPTSVLDAVQLHPNAQLYQVLKGQADALLQQVDEGATLATKIHHLVVHHFTEMEPDMETIARRLGMSSRSLRRRLQEEGVSFSKVVDDAMGELACNVLREPSTTIHEAAFRLGFSEASSFHRAFRRWTGKTPKQFRDSLAETGLARNRAS